MEKQTGQRMTNERSPGLLESLLSSLVAHQSQPKQVDQQVFEPACVQRWTECVAGMDDMARFADAQQVAA